MRTVVCLGLALVLGIAFAQSLTRQQFTSTFTSPEIGFICDSSPLRGGKPRLLCESPNGLATLELIGPSRDLESAGLMAFVTTEAAALSTVYILGFVRMVYPDWEGMSDWVTSAISRATEGRTVSHLRKGYEIEVSVTASLGLILVAVEPW